MTIHAQQWTPEHTAEQQSTLGRSRKAHTSFQMAAATKGTGDA